jgi:hypothetical protein
VSANERKFLQCLSTSGYGSQGERNLGQVLGTRERSLRHEKYEYWGEEQMRELLDAGGTSYAISSRTLVLTQVFETLGASDRQRRESMPSLYFSLEFKGFHPNIDL